MAPRKLKLATYSTNSVTQDPIKLAHPLEYYMFNPHPFPKIEKQGDNGTLTTVLQEKDYAPIVIIYSYDILAKIMFVE
ncbi:hypothetical protein NADFUDRAFT_69040 [Nadsonia fulvescens var. elongata DSM 6958]|uniref:Uncharacterized protein n=1 Tax=Nadsonia fulvescens var. elongata DSM 6958 TaxID=857566 RepID=A0A1E3PPC5_9ASCO|nr:hypothetical protein NADFUDRAFT_69040 [Nadsonia fulvescens var. elongata DSM 6958]